MLAPESGRFAIRALRVHVDFDSESSRALVDDLAGALAARPRLELWVVCPRSQRARLKQSFGDAIARGRVRPFFYDSRRCTMRIWPCDDGKPLRDGRLLVSTKNDPPSVGHQNAQIFMARHMRIGLAGSPIAFEGGDILCGERHVLLGEHTLDSNPHPGRPPARLARMLGELFEKPTLVLETPLLADPNQPKAFRHKMHVDTEVCLVFEKRTKRETALVGDPVTLLAALLSIPARRLRERRAFAAAAKRALGETALGRYFVDPLVDANWEAARRAQRHARALRRAGYPVRFVPAYLGLSKPLESSEKKVKKKTLRLVNYVNAVVDRGAIFLPWFDVPELDELVRGIVEGLGYRVIPMRSSQISLTLLGGPHCLSSAMRFAAARASGC